MFFPRPPTRGEYQVLSAVSCVLFLAVGIVGMAAGIMAPPEKQHFGHLAIGYGATSVGIGIVIAVGFWLIRRFTDD